MTNTSQTITLGGGCFWCTEAVYVNVKGIEDVEVGYCNGHTVQPSYPQVCTGTTGYNEVVKLVFDPAIISLREILEIFFLIHDPTTLNRQGNDSGTQYRSGIYWSHPEHAEVAANLILEMQADGGFTRPVVTEVHKLSNYWPAEEYHQDFFEKNPQQAYCVAVAGPKVQKFRNTFARLAKS